MCGRTKRLILRRREDLRRDRRRHVQRSAAGRRRPRLEQRRRPACQTAARPRAHELRGAIRTIDNRLSTIVNQLSCHRRRPKRLPEAQLLTEIVLLVFRVNGQLLAAGDRLVEGLGLTSARWQMLGAVALSDGPRTAPQLAAQMGMTRQAAQKQLDLLLDDGLVAAEVDPGHARSPLYVLAKKGHVGVRRDARIQADWANPAGSRASRPGT